jgi:hypothetical protein
MLKLMTIVGFVVLFLPVNGSEKESHPQKDKSESADVSNAAVTVINEQPSPQDQGRAKEQPKGYFETLFSANNLPNVALAIVGGLGIVLAWKTVSATKSAAAAAKLSAQAIINAERPWLLVEINRVEGRPGEWLVSARNMGETPAELIEGYVTAGAHEPGWSPPNEGLLAPFVITKTLFVKGESFPILIWNELPQLEFAQGFCRDKDHSEPRFIHVFGRVLYWDVFVDRKAPGSSPHVSQWNFIYNAHANTFSFSAGANYT